jgi:hypothetical protein
LEEADGNGFQDQKGPFTVASFGRWLEVNDNWGVGISRFDG